MLVHHTFASGIFSMPYPKSKAKETAKVSPVSYAHDHSKDAALIDALIEQKKARTRQYNQQVKLWRAIGFTLSLLLVIFVFQWKSYSDDTLFDLGQVDATDMELLEIPPTEQPPPPAPEQKVFNLVEVEDMEVIEEQVEVILDVDITEDMVIEETIYEMAKIEDEPEAEEVFFVVEEQPEPEGGMKAFYEYLSKSLNYPQKALEHNIGGKVFIQVTVSKTGELSDFVIVKGIGYGCDEEAMRVLKAAPKWKPGKQRGRAVNVRMVVPITFLMRTS